MPDRLRCRLLGCDPSEHGPWCERCGHTVYDAEFVVAGWLNPWFRFRLWLRAWTWPRCHHCGRRMFWRRLLGRSYDRELCSQECFDRWIPF